MNRVVITGLGIYSCIGKNLEEVKTVCCEGNQGLSMILFVKKWVSAVRLPDLWNVQT